MSKECPSEPTHSILTLPPEIHHLIASYLPIQTRPATLLALAITSTRLYENIQPLLYADVIVANEEHAYTVLGKILADKYIGLLVRKLHILSNLSVASRKAHNETRMLTRLHQVIKEGRLPNLHILGLVFLSGWYRDEDLRDLDGYGHLPLVFWEDLRRGCPLLRGLSLQGVGDTDSDPWMDESGLYELKNISHLVYLSLDFRSQSPSDGGASRILKSLSNLTSTLHTLALCFKSRREDATPVLALTFPHLKSLELSSFVVENTECAMEFWARHPGLERIILDRVTGKWFADSVALGLLPNLISLKTHYADVRAMASHLPQLQFLSVGDSINGQVPYLLRSVIPNGLPNLISLVIGQDPYSERDVKAIEGAMWYETEEGKFRQEKKISNAYRTMMDQYMHSIVRGAPNIEELCLHGFPLGTTNLQKLAPVLGKLPHLERFYYIAFGNTHGEITQSNVERFISDCHLVADSCPSLTSVTNVSTDEVPYLTGKVFRDDQGSVQKVIPGSGFGVYMLGGDVDPFPRNLMPYY